MSDQLPVEQRDQLCSVESLRQTFEDYIKSSDRWKDNTPLGVMTINGRFDHYMDANTDTMWIGFAIGYRVAIMKHLDAITKPDHAPSL
jgi:hypothetical protein